MTATFSPSLTTPKDKVRQALGDTDPAQALVQDETIDVLLGGSDASVLSVAAELAHNLAAQFARKVTFDVDGQGKRYSDLMEHYRTLAADLAARDRRARASEADADAVAAAEAIGGGIMVGGTSSSDIVDRLRDRDRAANYGASGWGDRC